MVTLVGKRGRQLLIVVEKVKLDYTNYIVRTCVISYLTKTTEGVCIYFTYLQFILDYKMATQCKLCFSVKIFFPWAMNLVFRVDIWRLELCENINNLEGWLDSRFVY